MNICIKGIPEGEDRKRRAESLFKEIMTEHLPNYTDMDMDIHIHEIQKSPSKIDPKKTRYNQIDKSQRQKEDLENSKRKATCHIEKNPDKAISTFLSRSLACQE